MRGYKAIIILFFILLLSCKKHETLPELDLGNDMNPQSGVQFAQIDSFRVISGIILKTYVGARIDLLSKMGVTVKRINVYKNGNPVSTTWVTLNSKYYLDNVVSGQKMTFEYSIVDMSGRESKKTIPYTISVP
ncbi:MAG: hypothetical protein K0S32_3476 [Bacteroidetes bacterium]|jgi:hypothetical protein|nr:hypothetical protein [Bacteroidota bacterium]